MIRITVKIVPHGDPKELPIDVLDVEIINDKTHNRYPTYGHYEIRFRRSEQQWKTVRLLNHERRQPMEALVSKAMDLVRFG